MTYLLIYLALGLPVVIVTALAGQDSTGKRIAQIAFFLPLWPVFPVAVAVEWLALKRIHERCFWCGEVVSPYNAPDREERWRAHHHQCQKHPLQEVINAQAQEIEELQAKLEKYQSLERGEE